MTTQPETKPAEASDAIYRNPVTDKEFTSHAEYVESLIESYKKVSKELNWAKTDEEKLVEALDKAAGETDRHKGLVKAEGTTQLAKVTRKQNVSYPKERGAEHPLRALMRKYPQLGEMVKAEYSEKGAAIADLIDRMHQHALTDPEDIALVDELLKVRTLKDGKPGIEIKDK